MKTRWIEKPLGCPLCGHLWCVPSCPDYDERHDPMLVDRDEPTKTERESDE